MTSLPYRLRFPFEQNDLPVIKMKMLNWLEPFSIFIYLDNNSYAHAPNRFEALAATGNAEILTHFPSDEELGDNWHFGHLAYDYKNTIEPRLQSRHADRTGFSDISFFKAEIVIYIPFGSAELVIESTHNNAAAILKNILETETAAIPVNGTIHWQSRIEREEYINIVEKIREHIIAGDCYELNFCMENFAEGISIAPITLFKKLNSANPAPFAAFYRHEDTYLISASPERFLWKDTNTLLSQPIKGTAARGRTDSEDKMLKEILRADEKERAENVMIVDLVRNDLAKSCIPGSISVPELFGTYSFPQVHQLISTVKGTLQKDVQAARAIQQAFPMGSMTGAPKMIVMQLIEQYERSRRGIYSGTVGYVTPGGDFDFNVVIRSLVYNTRSGYLSYHAGGAITYDSVPEKEWDEVMLKARAMKHIIQ